MRHVRIKVFTTDTERNHKLYVILKRRGDVPRATIKVLSKEADVPDASVMCTGMTISHATQAGNKQNEKEI